jgi:hypothetical protein
MFLSVPSSACALHNIIAHVIDVFHCLKRPTFLVFSAFFVCILRQKQLSCIAQTAPPDPRREQKVALCFAQAVPALLRIVGKLPANVCVFNVHAPACQSVPDAVLAHVEVRHLAFLPHCAFARRPIRPLLCPTVRSGIPRRAACYNNTTVFNVILPFSCRIDILFPRFPF